ncbi:hypothetical protein DCCM_4397 [Desulfocucumis palustris]|uniref:Uncharacterized protein n=1 Tax=Desulfocucumis palustris TaxID=1898651 RepID=A0A2L2XH03_9FIRM|nr:hypothetical protein [Desulfocucumis palustris]GBF35274.1 hypothetical protein DCCM_4397 [Desulfocucumis palustris]
MYFRLVKANHNGKEYQYLRLSESYRDGDKSRQRLIMNVANLSDLSRQKAESVVDKLQNVIKRARELRKYDMPWGKYYKIAIIMAVERIFKPSGCAEDVLGRVILSEKKRPSRSKKTVRRSFPDQAGEYGGREISRGLILLVKRLDQVINRESATAFFVFGHNGLPLKCFLPGTDINSLREVAEKYKPAFFLYLLCEKSYNAHEFKNVLLEKGEKPQLVYMYKPGTETAGAEKYYLISRGRAARKNVELAVSLVSQSIEHMYYVFRRLKPFVKNTGFYWKDAAEVFFTSQFYKKLIMDALLSDGIDFVRRGKQGAGEHIKVD